MKIVPLGDSAVLVEVGNDAARVRGLAVALAEKNAPGILDVIPAYTTVAVYYDAVVWSRGGTAKPFEAVHAWIEENARVAAHAKAAAAREHVIPVCYGGEFGPDLGDLAMAKGLSADDVVRLHSGATYEVRAIGFSPGFPYLAGLPEALHTPRRAEPRTAVPPGSVGIGGAQTGIYTLATPGGWHLLGRTPARLFRPEENEPALLKVGDKVRFKPIAADEFQQQGAR